MAMRLKDLVKLIDDKIKSHQWEIDKISDDFAVPMMTIEEMAEECKQFGEIDENDIRNINVTFWESGITADNESFVESMVAHCLFAKCKTDAERKATLDWLTDLQNNVCLPIVKKLNKWQHAKKKIDRSSLYGEFTKFDLIQRYGFLYDSDTEANQDANDKSATCPLLMGLLNSGWLNISAIEDKSTGKITVSVRDENFMFSPFTMLTHVKIAFETLLARREYQARRNAVRAESIWFSLRRRLNLRELNGMTHASVDCKPNELYAALEHILTDGSRYPQNVFDFKTANTDFLKLVKNAVCIIANLDETQHDVARQLFVNLLDGMKQMSEIESRLVKEQQERDPLTNRFIHPKYDISNNIFTLAIGTVIDMLEWQYNIINRMDLATTEAWRNMPENKGMWNPISSWEEEKSICQYIKAQYYAAGEKPPMVRHTEMKWTGKGWVQQVTEVPEFSC